VVKALCYKPEGPRLNEVNEFISIYLILTSALALGFTQPLTEMSTRAWPVRRADNLAAICEPIV
jgi:hypothetical protein